MFKLHEIVSGLLLLIFFFSASPAQTELAKPDKSEHLNITASASGERVRFTAPSSIVQIRLEVYNEAGKKLFDNEVHGGNVLDWHIQDGQAERLADDAYLCVITAKSVSGKLTQRIGSVTVEKATVSVQAAGASQMTPQQSETIGPVEENSWLTVMKENEPQTPTVIAHNGEDGHITRGRGALSFRIGDFFRGKDTEQMRLTPEGNLGIGITHPRARLDVDGFIRTSQGILFPDGTIQTTAAIAGSSDRTPDGTIQFGHISGSTSQVTSGNGGKNKKKFSPELFVNEDLTVNGNIIFTPPSPQFIRDITMQNNNGGLRFFGAPTLTNSPAAAAIQFWGNNSPLPGQLYLDAGAHDNSAVIIRSTGTGGTIAERMRVTATGNVGIGTNTPDGLLHVRGASPVRILGDPTGTLPGADYVDFMARSSFYNSDLGGMRIQRQPDTGDFDTLILAAASGFSAGERMRVTGNGRVGIGEAFPDAKLTVRASSESLAEPLIAVRAFNSPILFGVMSNGDVLGRSLHWIFGPAPQTSHICAGISSAFGTTTRQLTLCSSAAEYVPTWSSRDGSAEAGDLVSIVPVVRNPYGDKHAPFVVSKTSTACDPNLLGFLLDPKSGADGEKLNEHYLPLAVYGYFPAKVTLENGVIKRGDPITSSSKPGYGMKSTEACKVIGYALEDADQEGKIQVFAHLSEHSAPQVAALQAQVERLRRESTAREARLAALEQRIQPLKEQREPAPREKALKEQP